MTSIREIRRQKNSIQSIQQITKAMKLTSTVKLQKSRGKAEEARAYFAGMYRTVQSILGRSGKLDHRYLTPGKSGKKALIVISSNRGLAGGYNANIVRLILESDLKPEETVLYVIGKKAKEALERRGYPVCADYSGRMEETAFSDAKEISRRILRDFEEGKISEIYLAYTAFKNTVVHRPRLLKMLPVELESEVMKNTEEKQESVREGVLEYEPDEEEVLDYIIPVYLASILYGAINESAASEHGARMQAMDSATSNAEEMLEELSVQYNRARQASITQELTEIIAGAGSFEK